MLDKCGLRKYQSSGAPCVSVTSTSRPKEVFFRLPLMYPSPLGLDLGFVGSVFPGLWCLQPSQPLQRQRGWEEQKVQEGTTWRGGDGQPHKSHIILALKKGLKRTWWKHEFPPTDNRALQPCIAQLKTHRYSGFRGESQSSERVAHFRLIPYLALELSVMLPGPAVAPMSGTAPLECPRPGTNKAAVPKEDWSDQKCTYPALLPHALSRTGPECCQTLQELYLLLTSVHMWAVMPMVSIPNPATRPEGMDCMGTNGGKKITYVLEVVFSFWF